MQRRTIYPRVLIVFGNNPLVVEDFVPNKTISSLRFISGDWDPKVRLYFEIIISLTCGSEREDLAKRNPLLNIFGGLVY